MKVSFHYYTEHPEKLIRSFKHREKCAIEEIDSMEEILQYFQNTLDVDTKMLKLVQMQQSDLEDVAIITRSPVLSVFPILETKKQQDNETWIKFDTRPKSLAQKEVSLLAMQENQKSRIEVWSKGKMQASSDDQELGVFADFMWRYFARENVIIRQIEDATTYLRATQNVSQLEQYLRTPLFLPADWKMRWELRAISAHMFFCAVPGIVKSESVSWKG